MSITISNCDEICQSPTNSSKAKMLYTFSKGDRFSKRRIILCDKFYDVDKASGLRTTSFGVGNKYDFTKDVPKSPPPTSYNLKSDFDQDKKKGFGFGFGREELEVTGPFVETRKNKNPGPGTYDAKTTLEANTFSLRGKIEVENHEKLRVPGPGAYPIPFSISEKGSYFLSRYKNCLVRTFKTNQSRNRNLDNKIPGPGAYDYSRTDFSPNGRYYLSKTPSVLSRRFGTSSRSQVLEKVDTPGPGNYRLPSQFGYYISKNALRKPATEENSRKVNKEDREARNISENKQNVKE